MAWRFALLLVPASATDARTDFRETFTEVDPLAPGLSVGDLAAQRGDGVFESIGVIGGHAQEVEAHLARLEHSAELCELPRPHLAQWRQAVELAVTRAGSGEAVIKLILSRGVEHGSGPTAWVTVADAADFAAARTSGVRVATLDRGFASDVPARAPWLLLGAKTLSYAVNMAAIREAKRRGADDAVFVTTDGYVLEAPTASVVVRRGTTFVTPEPHAGILHGTTQRSLFGFLQSEGYETAYEPIPVADLLAAEAAWLLSSVRLAAPITAVDGRAIPHDPAVTSTLNDYLLGRRD